VQLSKFGTGRTMKILQRGPQPQGPHGVARRRSLGQRSWTAPCKASGVPGSRPRLRTMEIGIA
jgi:hypothetical protein